MKRVLNLDIKAGSGRTREPRLAGDIVKEMFRGNSPLANGYRKYLASKENRAEKGAWA